MLVQGEELRRWLEEALGYALPVPATFIGQVGDDGLPICIAGFADWRLFEVEVYFWCAGTMTRRFIHRVAQYAFDELKVRYVRATAAADATDWIQQIERIGFQSEGRKRGGFDGQIDLMLYGITREELRI